MSIAVRPPPITTTGSRSCMFAIESAFAAPVSCSAIRKSLAVRTPRARPFGMSSVVGRPAPIASATWSKPSRQASSTVSVPPKRTPPWSAKRARRSSSSRISFRKFLFQRTVMPYSATPPKPAIARSSSDSYSVATSRTGSNGTRVPSSATPESAGGSGSIFSPSIATTWCPSFIRWCASVKPAGPVPTTSTLRPLSGAGSGRRRFSGFQRDSSA